MTRGYFTLLNTEERIEDPYQRYNDILVEGCGDGYFNTIMNDIFKIGETFAESYLERENIGKVRLLKELKREQDSFSSFMNEAGAILLFDLTWVDFLGLLQFTVPFRYSEIDEGVTRYGAEVTFKSSYFTVSFMPSRYQGKCIIELDENTLHEDDIIYLQQCIDERNAQYLGCKECHFQMKDHTITFDLLRQLYFKIYTHEN